MPSVLTLIHLPSRGSKDEPGISDLAREADLSGRGSMTKAEKIIALADEELPEEAREIVLASSKDLTQRARERDVDGYSKLTKSELQEHFLKEIFGKERSRHGQVAEAKRSSRSGRPHSNGVSSDTGPGAKKAPPPEAPDPSAARSHFGSDEERRHAIRDAAHRALDTALEEKRSYVVVESFRAQDEAQPLSIQPAYMQRHEDTQPVCEILIPHLAHRR